MSRRAVSGFALLEVLIALVVATFGVLALATLHNRAALLELEASQRAQALTLLQDLVERIGNNRPNAATYVADDIGVQPLPVLCSSISDRAARDLCEWSKTLKGFGADSAATAEVTGAVIGARGCVRSADPGEYRVMVAWQGLLPSAVPAADCGIGDYGADDRYRRAIGTVLRFATLVDLPAAAP